jgi:hypothetical protein
VPTFLERAEAERQLVANGMRRVSRDAVFVG